METFHGCICDGLRFPANRFLTLFCAHASSSQKQFVIVFCSVGWIFQACSVLSGKRRYFL